MTIGIAMIKLNQINDHNDNERWLNLKTNVMVILILILILILTVESLIIINIMMIINFITIMII